MFRRRRRRPEEFTSVERGIIGLPHIDDAYLGRHCGLLDWRRWALAFEYKVTRVAVAYYAWCGPWHLVLSHMRR